MEGLMKTDGRWKVWLGQEQGCYLRELTPYLITSVLLMGAGIVLGLVAAVYSPSMVTLLREPLTEFVKMFLGLPKVYMALAIFLNNALKVLIVIIVGTLLGVLPVIFLLGNGCIIGMVLYISAQSNGMLATLLIILPHGLFEFPAALLGTSMGLMHGVHAAQGLFGKRGMVISGELGRALRFYLIIIVPILFLAAFVETFITPYFVSG